MLLAMAAIAHDPSRTRLTRAEYDTLVERGVLQEAKVELLYGRIVSMPPIGRLHVYSVQKLVELLMEAPGKRAQVRRQQPFAAPDESEPEPDVAVVPPGDYLDDHPKTAHLLIEVADSSLVRDREKAMLYAAAVVTEYWIVNLVDDEVEVYRDAKAGVYRTATRHVRGDVLRLVSFPDVEVRVADVLPPQR